MCVCVCVCERGEGDGCTRSEGTKESTAEETRKAPKEKQKTKVAAGIGNAPTPPYRHLPSVSIAGKTLHVGGHSEVFHAS